MVNWKVTDMNIAVAGLSYETNSFAPGVTSIDTFKRVLFTGGNAVLTAGAGQDTISGARQVADAAGVELTPVFTSTGGSGPIVTADAHHALKTRLVQGIAAVQDRVDGIYLALHGAMVAQGCEDVEGDLLRAVRDCVGTSMPIAVSCDLHCHFTDLMASGTACITGYQTCPHIDQFETGARAMRLLLGAVSGRTTPVLRYRKIRMMSSSEAHDTTEGPVQEVMARLHEIETEEGVLDATLFLTQPWLDVTELGWTALVVTDGDPELAQDRADSLARMLWDRRTRTLVPKTPISTALSIVASAPADGGPVVLSDGADSTSAGSSGDGVALLTALLEDRRIDGPVILSVTDAPGVIACFEAGVGATVSRTIGGTLAPQYCEPVQVDGRVVTLCEGRYVSKYSKGPANVGRVAVIESGNISIVVTEFPASMLDHQLYLRVGLDPREARLVQVKSAGGYRAFYSPIAQEMIDIDTRGAADSDLTRLPFTRPRRPLWPFDQDIDEPW